jgi:hypothetical protein
MMFWENPIFGFLIPFSIYILLFFLIKKKTGEPLKGFVVGISFYFVYVVILLVLLIKNN